MNIGNVVIDLNLASTIALGILAGVFAFNFAVNLLMNSHEIEKKVSVTSATKRVEIDGHVYLRREVSIWIGNKASWWKKIRARILESKLWKPHRTGASHAFRGKQMNNPYPIGSVDHDEYTLGYLSESQRR